MASVRHPRGTFAAFLALAAANQLIDGQIYILNDVGRLAIALSANTYSVLPNVSDSNLPFPIRTATPKIAGAANGTALGTLALTASRQYFVPFVVPVAIELKGIRISVTTLAAGQASAGIYSNTLVSGSDSPGALLASVSGLDTGTTGNKTGTVSYNLEANRLYWASVIGSAAATVRALAVGGIQSCLGFTVNSTTVISHLFAAGSGSTLPATASTTPSDGTASVPAIYLVGS